MNALEHLERAYRELAKVRDAMLDALLESDGRITSDDFEPLNALDKKIEELKSAYAPGYQEFRFADLVESVKAGSDDKN